MPKFVIHVALVPSCLLRVSFVTRRSQIFSSMESIACIIRIVTFALTVFVILLESYLRDETSGLITFT